MKMSSQEEEQQIEEGDSFKSVPTFMGHRDAISVLLHLTRMELYKIRHRRLVKVLGTVSIVTIVGFFLAIFLYLWYTPRTIMLPPPCSQSPGVPNCLNHQPPTTAEVQQAKQEAWQRDTEALRLPMSLHYIVEIAITVCTLLAITLAGTIVGGEYSIGMVRLMFTRGPTRTQFLTAKIAAMVIWIIAGILWLTLIGIIWGYILNGMLHVNVDIHFFNKYWVGHALLYLLAAMLSWFMYTLIALFFGTIGRTSVAGIVGGMAWFFLDPALVGALNLVKPIAKGPVGNIIKVLPDYFLSSNTGALLQNQEHYLFEGKASSLSDVHALIVLGIYILVFISFALWVNESRDITN